MEDWITIRNPEKRNPNMETRAIAKKLDLSRNTVKKALQSEDPPAYKRKTYTNPELKPFKGFIIEKYFIKKMKGSRVLNDLRSKGCKVSSSAFYRYIQLYKTEFTRAYMRYETKPGEQGQFDWTPKHVRGHYTICIFLYLLDITIANRLKEVDIGIRSLQKVYEVLKDSIIGKITMKSTGDEFLKLMSPKSQ